MTSWKLSVKYDAASPKSCHSMGRGDREGKGFLTEPLGGTDAHWAAVPAGQAL